MSPEKLADGHGIATCSITWKQGCLEKLPLFNKPSNMSLIMKIYKVGLPFIGMSSLMLLMSPLANAAEMSNMDHGSMDMSGMDMSDMDHSSMDMSGMGMSDMDHSKMDMSGMDMSDMDHSGMDMSGMDHGSMDMSGMDHGSMDMSGMKGGKAPADARSPDYSNGVPYGRFGKPVMMGS